MPYVSGVSVRLSVATELPKTVPCPSNVRLNFNGFRLARKPALVDGSVTAHIIKMATGMIRTPRDIIVTSFASLSEQTGSSVVSAGIYTAMIRIKLKLRL